MTKKLILNRWTLTLVAICGAYALGYYFAPDKIVIKEEEKIVYRTEVETEENKKVTEKFDPETGKIVERIEETERRDRTVDQLDSEQKKETTTEKTQKNFALKVGQSFRLSKEEKIKLESQVVGAEMRIPSLPFTPNWAGLDMNTDFQFNAYVRFEF